MSKRKDSKLKPVSIAGASGISEHEGAESPKAVEIQSKGGRPTSLNQEIADRICEHIEDGGSLRSFCAEDGNPPKQTVLRWLRNVPSFRAQYASARARGMDAHAEEILQIVDDSGLDVIGVNEKTGQPIVDGEAIARARLRYDARRWLMSKLAPKKYGDKVELEHTGEQKHTITFKRG